MANKNISDFLAVSSLTGAELMEVQQGGVNKRATLNNVVALVTGSKVYYTSIRGLVSDAGNLLTANDTTGKTNNTSAMQTLLNLATSTNPIKIIVDGQYAVDGLDIKGNTTIECLQGCGFITRNGANRPLLRNANKSFNPASRIDKDITITGGIWNGNYTKQTVKGNPTYGLVSGMQWIGVENLTIQNARVIEHKTYGIEGVNLKTYRNYSCIVTTSNTDVNTDGVHFDGNSEDGVIKDLTFLGEDDGVALLADDNWQEVSAHYTYPYYSQTANGGYSYFGPIKGARIENVYNLTGARSTIRLLSATHLIDDVYVKNILGDVTQKWLETDRAGLIGSGNIGTVTIDGVKVNVTAGGIGYTASVICKCDTLIFKNIVRDTFPTANQASIYIGNSSNVKNMIIDGYVADDSSANATAHILSDNGVCETLTLRNIHVKQTANHGSIIFKHTGGTIGRLILEGVEGLNVDNIFSATDNLDYVIANCVVHTGASAGEGSFKLAAGKTVKDICLDNYYGFQILSSTGTWTKKRGYCFHADFTLPDVPSSGGGSYTDVVFDTFWFGVFTNTSGVWTNDQTDDAYGHKATRNAETLAAGAAGGIQCKYESGVNGIKFGWNGDDVSAGGGGPQPYLYVGFEFLAGALRAYEGGGGSTALGTPAYTFYRCTRDTSGNFKLQGSNDESSWTDVFSYTTVSTIKLWAFVDIAGGASYSLHYPKATGLA